MQLSAQVLGYINKIKILIFNIQQVTNLRNFNESENN